MAVWKLRSIAGPSLACRDSKNLAIEESICPTAVGDWAKADPITYAGNEFCRAKSSASIDRRSEPTPRRSLNRLPFFGKHA